MSEKPLNEHPAWLKAMQNGSIGEARARAFLLDRFWVLERSVDIDGADLIIQRRITSKNLLDREAPRLGVVQVKFFGTAGTSHYVHKQYVVDLEEKPRDEFFLLGQTGGEENPMAFLLTAAEIHKGFQLTVHADSEKYYIPFAQISNNGRYEIRSRKLALDRIENQLKLADFTMNRRFLSWVLPSAETAVDAILPEFREPLPNWWGDIPEGFKDFKDMARTALIDVEEIYNLILKIAEETDPIEAEKTVKKIEYHCRDGRGDWSISLPKGLDDEDLFMVSREHRALWSQLKIDGLLDEFIGLRSLLKKEILQFLEPHYPFHSNLVHRFVVHYKVGTFTLERVESSLTEAAELVEAPQVINEFGHLIVPPEWVNPAPNLISPGQVQVSWLPGRYGYTRKGEEESFLSFSNFNFAVYDKCIMFIHGQKYGTSI